MVLKGWPFNVENVLLFQLGKNCIIKPNDLTMSLICISLEITLLEKTVLTHSLIMRVFSLMTKLIIT